MVTSSFDRITGTLGQRQYQPYNNFRIQNRGGNIIQGQMNKLSVTELMFPYNITTIVAGQNDLISLIIRDISSSGVISFPYEEYTFRIPAGWYTGTELVAELNGLIDPVGPEPMSNHLLFSWDSVANRIEIETAWVWNTPTPVYGNPGELVELNTDFLYQLGPVPPSVFFTNPFNYPNAFWTAGFRNTFASAPYSGEIDCFDVGAPAAPLEPDINGVQLSIYPTGMPIAFALPNSFEKLYGSYYTGRYTDFVDIVSRSLCQAQYTRDSTTSQNTAQRDVIARVYVCNDISTLATEPEGTRPFIIHRMFPVPKVMKWTADRSIDAIELALYDMYGQPLPNTLTNTGIYESSPSVPAKYADAGESDYAITFHVHEPSDVIQNENVGYKF
jgi:hypothetical protein